MTVVNDLSLNTVVVSAVIAGAAFLLKGAAWGLGVICQNLIQTLLRTITKVEVLESKIQQVLETHAEVQKLKQDMNGAYARLREFDKRLPT